MAKTTQRRVTSMAITKARVNLGAVVRRVHLNKEYIILKKGGIPVVGLMDADELEDYLEVHNPAVQELIELSNQDIRAGRTRPAREFLAELQAGSKVRPNNRKRHAASV